MGRLSTGVIFVLVLLLSHSHGYIIGEDSASVETLYHIQHSKNILAYLDSKQILCIYSLFNEYFHNVTFFENMFFGLHYSLLTSMKCKFSPSQLNANDSRHYRKAVNISSKDHLKWR